MKTRELAWSVARLMDFEYALLREPVNDSAAQHRRDREIYNSFLSNSPARLHDDRSSAFAYWLEAVRRHREKLPGGTIVGAWSVVSTSAVFAAFFAGLAYAGGLLVLQGRDDYVSAPRVWILTLGLQLLVFIAVALVLTFAPQREVEFGSVRVRYAAKSLRRFGLKVRAPIGVLSEAASRYRRLLLKNIGSVAQACMAAMNLGILVSLAVFHFSVSQLRFGWTATHDYTPQNIASAASFVAKPWSWLVPSAVPTLDQVRRSRAGTKDFAEDTEPGNASRAWAYFLLASLATYGVLLRAIVARALAWSADRSLRWVKFDGREMDELWRRMTSPPTDEPAQPPLPAPKPKRPWWPWLTFRKKP